MIVLHFLRKSTVQGHIEVYIGGHVRAPINLHLHRQPIHYDGSVAPMFIDGRYGEGGDRVSEDESRIDVELIV